MSDKQVERVYSFIRDLLRQHEVCSNTAEVWNSAFPVKEDIPSLLLPILCCQAVGGDENQATVVAAAWFLLCLAARILDDIEDNDALQPPWSAIGAPQAINAATGLIFASQLALAHLPRMGAPTELTLSIIEDFNRTVLRMCAGQHADLAEDSTSSPQDYFRIAGAKSGEFFALACRAGALLGTYKVAPYSEFGYNLGVLIQICDDFEGIWNPKGRSDLAAGKRTLPVVYALTVAPPGLREHLERLLARATGEREAEEEARQIITELGAPHYLLTEAWIHRQRAEAALHSTGEFSPAHRRLMALLNERLRVPDDAAGISLVADSIQDKDLALLGPLLSSSDRPRPAGGGLQIRLDPTLRRPLLLTGHFSSREG